MKIPYSMLLEYVKTNLKPQEVGDLLTMLGFELEGIEIIEDEPVLHINITANRGDISNAYGFAREILAKDPFAQPTDLYIQATKRFSIEETCDNDINISIKTQECSRYSCRLFKNIQNIDSPKWLKKRMTQMGIRSINLIVDLTNYVMLELGQPMHAFDLDKISGNTIFIREAIQGEKLKTLDAINHDIYPGQILICDQNGPIAIAGVIGGKSTEVTDSTTNILLESTHFLPDSIRKSRKKMHLSTEASHRFERWVDPEGTVRALNRFRMLYIQITDNNAGCVYGVKDSYPHTYQTRAIPVRMSRVKKIFGVSISAEKAHHYLSSLGFTVTDEGEPFMVHCPSWRPDIKREIDLVEEIGRVYGYEHIPEQPVLGITTLGGVFGSYQKIDSVVDMMIRNGFNQTISHSMRGKHFLDDPISTPIILRNPHSPEVSYMRNSLLPSLCDVSKRNDGKNIHFFEVGKVLQKSKLNYLEHSYLGIWSQGALNSINWIDPSNFYANFYTLKGSIECISRIFKLQLEYIRPQTPDCRFHSGRQAEILNKNHRIGIMGQIHPNYAEKLDIPETTYMAELNLDLLFAVEPEILSIKTFSKNPSIRRDIAIVIKKSIPYNKIEKIIQDSCENLLEKIWLFDVFSGKGIPESHHSLGITLILRKQGQNLTDEEANLTRDKVMVELGKLGAILR